MGRCGPDGAIPFARAARYNFIASRAKRVNDWGVTLPSSSALDSLAGYPAWFVAACLTVVAAVLIWLFAKVLKWALYLLIGLVLIGGAATTLWLLLH